MKLISFLIAFGLSASVMAADAMQEDTGQPASSPAEASTPSANESSENAADSSMPATTQATNEEAATSTESTAAADEQAGFSRGSVVRSVFTSSVQDREPIDKLKKTAATDRVFYFTELRDMSGQTATHRWEHDGKVMAEVKFDVRGPRWRVWSSKSFVPNLAGDWKVSVLNGAGETISEEMIKLTDVPADTGTTEAMPAATDKTDMSAPADSEAGTASESQPAVEEFQPPVNPDMIQ
jgi:hypothetical protein